MKRRTFEIKIDLENAAFGSATEGDPTEIPRILRAVASRMERQYVSRLDVGWETDTRDSNGNVVGKARIYTRKGRIR